MCWHFQSAIIHILFGKKSVSSTWKHLSGLEKSPNIAFEDLCSTYQSYIYELISFIYTTFATKYIIPGTLTCFHHKIYSLFLRNSVAAIFVIEILAAYLLLAPNVVIHRLGATCNWYFRLKWYWRKAIICSTYLPCHFVFPASKKMNGKLLAEGNKNGDWKRW